MSQHLFVTVVTPTAVAANNRGEGDGSTLSTLQKITRGSDQYTTVSAEAIRWGMREYFQNTDEASTNRTFNPDTDNYAPKFIAAMLASPKDFSPAAIAFASLASSI